MPGAYAHITAVNLARDIARMEAANIPPLAIQAVLNHLGFCELGAVSPDYPYLHLGSSKSKRWADLMHYQSTAEPIQRGIEFARRLNKSDKAPVAAWLMGYVAHVVADVTIHPVVELRVGPYAANATQHRICEMNQDAYIFQRLNLDEVGRSEHLDKGIWRCCDAPDSGRLDRAIVLTWEHMLSASYPEEFRANRPDFHGWHAGFKRAVDVAEEGYRMPAFARHVAADCGLTYPDAAHVDQSFIKNLATPEGSMDYDAIFDRAVENIATMWAWIGAALYEGDDSYLARIDHWNLDTGKNSAGHFGFWSNKVEQFA